MKSTQPVQATVPGTNWPLPSRRQGERCLSIPLQLLKQDNELHGPLAKSVLKHRELRFPIGEIRWFSL